jgi:hypothetical protein
MAKKLTVNCFLVEHELAQAFRDFVHTYDDPSTYEAWQAQEFEPVQPTVEILYEEGNSRNVGFDLWFVSPSAGFYFGQAWERKRQAVVPAKGAQVVELNIDTDKVPRLRQIVSTEQWVRIVAEIEIGPNDAKWTVVTLALDDVSKLFMLGQLFRQNVDARKGGPGNG